MSNEEHYFENLLFYGKDVTGNINKNSILKEKQEVIEMCANYVIYSLFYNREDFNNFLKQRM